MSNEATIDTASIAARFEELAKAGLSQNLHWLEVFEYLPCSSLPDADGALRNKLIEHWATVHEQWPWTYSREMHLSLLYKGP